MMINYESVKRMYSKPNIHCLPKENKQSRYSVAFKKEVVARYRRTNKMRQTADFYNVAHNTLRAWINEV